MINNLISGIIGIIWGFIVGWTYREITYKKEPSNQQKTFQNECACGRYK